MFLKVLSVDTYGAFLGGSAEVREPFSGARSTLEIFTFLGLYSICLRVCNININVSCSVKSNCSLRFYSGSADPVWQRFFKGVPGRFEEGGSVSEGVLEVPQ